MLVIILRRFITLIVFTVNTQAHTHTQTLTRSRRHFLTLIEILLSVFR